MNGTILPGENSPTPQRTAEPREFGGVKALPLGCGGQTPYGQLATLVQVAGWALADIGVRDPSAALLEPLAIALFPLDAAPFQEDRTEL